MAYEPDIRNSSSNSTHMPVSMAYAIFSFKGGFNKFGIFVLPQLFSMSVRIYHSS